MAERHGSFWIETSPPTAYPPVTADVTVDVAIVGGGIVGITAATFLKEAGKTVAVLEAAKVAEGVTGHTTAKVTSLHTLIYDDLISQFGREKAQAYGEANEAAIATIRRLCHERSLDCELSETTAYTFAESNQEVEKIEREVEAAQSLGLPGAYYDEVPLPFAMKGAVAFSGQAQFHPRKYLLPLVAALPGAGSHVFEQTRVVDIEDGPPARALTEASHVVVADDVIIATNLPIVNKGLFFARAEPQRGYALAMEPGDVVPEGLFINTSSPSHSVRSARYAGRQILILAGEGHPVGEAQDTHVHWQRLAEWARSDLGAGDVLFRWSTQDYYSLDKLPFIGRLDGDHVYTATGFSAWGMTNGTVAGIVLADLILGVDNPWAALYDPQRTNVKTLPAFVKKGVHDAKRFLGDRLADGVRAADTNEIAPGGGQIVEVEGQKLAVYRDDDSTLHVLSAVCTHMGCIVSWNDGERSWDCPCHGSRFTPDGEVLEGPATARLDNRREVLAEERTG